MRVLITGASGFVGSALVSRAIEGHSTTWRVALRRGGGELQKNLEQILVGEIDANTDWRNALADVNIVVHLAARAHVIKDEARNPLAAFRRVNVGGTLNLARQAAAVGVARFVFLSSVKVNGEGEFVRNSQPIPYRESDPPAPKDAYGISKHEAELGLREIAATTGMEVVIIRPPLVYGSGVSANFRSLMRVVAYGIPLPLGSVSNRRSLVSCSNLVDFILTCLVHPAAANETFLVSDGEDLSTTELLRRLGHCLDRPARLFAVPPRVLWIVATLLGGSSIAQRLLGSLQVDISKARERLGWTPPLSVNEGLKQAAATIVPSK